MPQPKKWANQQERNREASRRRRKREATGRKVERMLDGKRAAEREAVTQQAAAEIAAKIREDAHASSDPVARYREAKNDPRRLARQAALYAQIRAAIQKADCDAKADAEKRKRGGRPRKRIALNIVGADPKDVYGEWWGQR